MTGTRGTRSCSICRSGRVARRRWAGARRRRPDRGRRRAGAACSKSAAPIRLHLVRVAWHLGNRHLPTQMLANVAAHPARPRDRGHGGGARRHVIEIEAPFDPEGGAYAAASAGTITTTADHQHDSMHHDHPASSMSDEICSPALYRLMTWLSPAFPVGAFSYSSGIEWAVEAGDIVDAAILAGLAWCDACATGRDCAMACFCAHAHRPLRCGDETALRDARRACGGFRALARTPARDDSAQGRAFIDVARAAWPCGGA